MTDDIKRVVSVQKSTGKPKIKELVITEAQIAFSQSQNQQFMAPKNRVFRYRTREDMNRDMEEWVVKTIVAAQLRRDCVI